MFLADVMVSKLGRWLRIMGIPTEMPEKPDDAIILSQAKAKDLIILTMDEELVEKAKKRNISAFLIPSKEIKIERQLARVIKAYNLKIEGFEERTLCTKCGSELELVGKKDVEGRVPDDVLKKFDDFLRCKNPKCSQVYWEGSHWKKITETIERVKKQSSESEKKE